MSDDESNVTGEEKLSGLSNDALGYASENGGNSVANLLGCLGGIVGFTFMFLALLAGCTKKPATKVYAPFIADNLSIIEPSTEKNIQSIVFPKDIPVLIETIDTIPEKGFGKYATKRMAKHEYWSGIRPVSFLRKYFRQQKPWEKGIYILVSKKPLLIQIRYGDKIRLDAYAKGIAAGPWYHDQQDFDISRINEHLIGLVSELSNKVEDIHDRNIFYRFFRYLGSFAWSSVEDMIMISDNVFSNTLVKNYLKLVSWVGGTSSIGVFLLISFIFLGILHWINNRLIMPISGRLKKAGGKIGLYITASGIEIISILISLAALLVLVRGRMEDQIALQQLGFEHIDALGANLSFFTKQGGLLFAIPFAIVALLKEFIETNSAANENQANIPVLFLGWGFLFYVLPRAIGVFLIFYLVVGLIKVVSALAREQ